MKAKKCEPRPQVVEPDCGGMAEAPILGLRSPSIDVLRGLLAFWVLGAHLFAWSGTLNQGSIVLTAMFERLGQLFQSNGETHPAVLGFIVLSGYCIHRTGFRRQAAARSQLTPRAESSESGRSISLRRSSESHFFSPLNSRTPALPQACRGPPGSAPGASWRSCRASRCSDRRSTSAVSRGMRR
jgi:hypothetical protein